VGIFFFGWFGNYFSEQVPQGPPLTCYSKLFLLLQWRLLLLIHFVRHSFSLSLSLSLSSLTSLSPGGNLARTAIEFTTVKHFRLWNYTILVPLVLRLARVSRPLLVRHTFGPCLKYNNILWFAHDIATTPYYCYYVTELPKCIFGIQSLYTENVGLNIDVFGFRGVFDGYGRQSFKNDQNAKLRDLSFFK